MSVSQSGQDENKSKERLARESQNEREAKLERTSTIQRQRLTRESPDEREARLERMSTNQRQKFAISLKINVKIGYG